MKVLKFGGTSVGTVESILNVKKIVATVHPENIYSSRNFDILGYKVINEITIHGGKRLIYCIEV